MTPLNAIHTKHCRVTNRDGIWVITGMKGRLATESKRRSGPGALHPLLVNIETGQGLVVDRDEIVKPVNLEL